MIRGKMTEMRFKKNKLLQKRFKKNKKQKKVLNLKKKIFGLDNQGEVEVYGVPTNAASVYHHIETMVYQEYIICDPQYVFSGVMVILPK
jgi:hypothetical protein